MKFTKDAIGGSDMTNVPDAREPFSVDRYLNIPEDTDYLTIQFGLNETEIADEPSTLGTSADSDNTTMWGHVQHRARMDSHESAEHQGWCHYLRRLDD